MRTQSMKAEASAEKGQIQMKKMMKRIGAFCCSLALLTLLCMPTVASAEMMNGGRDGNMLPDGIEYPMRRAVRDGRDAMDDMLPGAEQGTVNDRTQGASDGVLDGSQGITDDGASAGQSGSAGESGTTAPTDGEDQKEEGISTVAIVIAIIAAIAIVVLIFIAIPKSKSKPGGTGNKN